MSGCRRAPSPLERGGDFKGARRAEIELILIARIGPGRVNGVGYVAHAECDANVLELRRSEVAAWNVHERKDIGRCATEFERKVTDLDDLITELRAGRFKPAVLRPTPTR